MDRRSLETMLVEVGTKVSFPETPPLVDDVTRRLTEPSPSPVPHRWLRVAIIAAVVVIVTVAALPGPRRAIADLLGLGGVKITIAPNLPPSPTTDSLVGEETTLEAAQFAAEFTLLIPDGYGEPDAVFVDDVIPGGLVTLAYQPGQDSYGLVITEMLGSVNHPFLEKVIGPEATVTTVEVAGRDGYWIEGRPHLLIVLDADGADLAGEPRLVGNTLLYVVGDVTVRIESALDLAGALLIADALRSFDP